MFELKYEIYYETTIHVSFSLYVYFFAKTELKLILFLYASFMYFEFIPRSPYQIPRSVLDSQGRKPYCTYVVKSCNGECVRKTMA